jgi:transcriptional regulator with XRE-family HTH domain
MSVIGDRIKAQRQKLGWTQASLGERLGRGESTVRMWELGKSNPPYDELKEMSYLFNVTISYLIGKDEDFEPFDGLDPVSDKAFFSVMKRVKDQGLSPEDVKKAIEFYTYAQTYTKGVDQQ